MKKFSCTLLVDGKGFSKAVFTLNQLNRLKTLKGIQILDVKPYLDKEDDNGRKKN